MYTKIKMSAKLDTISCLELRSSIAGPDYQFLKHLTFNGIYYS